MPLFPSRSPIPSPVFTALGYSGRVLDDSNMHPKVENHYSKNIILFIPYVRGICLRPFVLLVFFQVVSLFSCDFNDCLFLFTIPRVRLVCVVFSPEKHLTAKQLARPRGAARCEETRYSTSLADQPSQNVTLGICWLSRCLILVTRSRTKNKQGKTSLQPTSCDRNILRLSYLTSLMYLNIKNNCRDLFLKCVYSPFSIRKFMLFSLYLKRFGGRIDGGKDAWVKFKSNPIHPYRDCEKPGVFHSS